MQNIQTMKTLLLLLLATVSGRQGSSAEAQRQLVSQQLFHFKKLTPASDKEPVLSTNTPEQKSSRENLKYRLSVEREFKRENANLTEESGMLAAESIDIPVMGSKRDREYEYDSGHSGVQSDQRSGGSSDLGGSYGGGHGSGHKVKPRKPGPYGKPTPNFKCVKSSETLYVTKTELTFDKKCFNVFNVKCTESYDEGKVGFIFYKDHV